QFVNDRRLHHLDAMHIRPGHGIHIFGVMTAVRKNPYQLLWPIEGGRNLTVLIAQHTMTPVEHRETPVRISEVARRQMIAIADIHAAIGRAVIGRVPPRTATSVGKNRPAIIPDGAVVRRSRHHRCERPSSCRAAEKCDQLAPPHAHHRTSSVVSLQHISMPALAGPGGYTAMDIPHNTTFTARYRIVIDVSMVMPNDFGIRGRKKDRA